MASSYCSTARPLTEANMAQIIIIMNIIYVLIESIEII